jgi:predicted nucleic acid-binding Zn ribbon protein
MRRGLQLGRLVRDWERVAGEALAAHTRPVALTPDGLVVKAATAAWAAQVRFLAEDLRRRANEALGGRGVRAVRVVVGPVEEPRSRGAEPPGW